MLKIYHLQINDYADLTDNDLACYVTTETLQLAQTFRHPKVRRTKLLGEGMLRQLLRQIWGLQNPDYQIVRSEHGKPFLKNIASPLFFNISHSGNYIVCALSDREIGIDIEKKGKVRMQVARRFFHSSEIQHLQAVGEDKQAALFFRYWSAKESYLKYTGSGLSSPLSGFEVCFQEKNIQIKKEHSQIPVYIRECLIDNDYACFLCSEVAEEPQINKFDLF